MHATTLTLLTSLVLSGPTARSEVRSPTRHVEIDLCIVSLIHDVEVPAQESGPLVFSDVKDGTPVKKGQLLAKTDDQLAQLEKYTAEIRRDAALARAESNVEINIAQATYETTSVELQQRVRIRQRSGDAVTESEIRRLELARDNARFKVEKGKLDQRIARMNANSEEASVRAAEDSIARRRIVSPIDGQVVAVFRELGEWVNAGEPVVRVVRMDRLRVEGHLSAKDFNPSEIGNRSVTVRVQLARGRVAQFTGKVTYISPLLKAGDIYRVRAEVDNQSENGFWVLQPGATVAMTIHLGG